MLMTENKQVVGTLYTSIGNFDLLQLNPVKTFTPIANAEVFYVVDSIGRFAVNITVKGDFVIVPLLVPVIEVVHFLVEDETKDETQIPEERLATVE